MRWAAEGPREPRPGTAWCGERHCREHEGGRALGASMAHQCRTVGGMAAGGRSLHAVPACGLTPLVTSSAVPGAVVPDGGWRSIPGAGRTLPSSG